MKNVFDKPKAESCLHELCWGEKRWLRRSQG